ncbi:MAG: nucleotide exchange factor GrpE [Dehalococcoidales bacterium]|nr:nucleotide exchange factor GrpE [Dehalococcoidales bacterium]
MKHDKENLDIGNDEVQNAEAQEADLAADKPPVSAEEALAACEEKASQYLARLQRAQADYINYKRRVEQERSEFVRQAGADVILGILPVLDDIDRALESVPADIKDHSWVDGVRHISRKLHSELEARGLEKIESRGQTFDPNIHESVALAKGKEDVVVEEVKPGYRLYDRILRPCSVVVGSGEE